MPSSAAVPNEDRRPKLAEEESFIDDFKEPGRWPEPAVVEGGLLALGTNGGMDAFSAAPYRTPEDVAGLMVGALVTLDGPGQAGVFCLGPPGDAPAYVLWYDPAGLVTIMRRQGSAETVVGQASVDPTARSDPGEDILLRLFCAQTAEGVNLAYTVNASPLDASISDAGGRLPEGPLAAGVGVRAGADATAISVSDFRITLFRAPE